MAERKPQWPEVGDLVIATIENVTTYGGYAKLNEYNKQGLLHVSEISSSWIRNIRDFVREAKKAEKPKDADVRFYVIASPKYSLEVSAENYKRAEEILQKVSQGVVSNIVKTDDQGNFRREK